MTLGLAESYDDQDTPPLAEGDFAQARAVATPLFVAESRGRYGEKRGPNLPAIIITAAIHAIAIIAILYVRYDAPLADKEEKLTVVDLTPPPSPPAPETPPAPPQIMAPTPPIAVPRPLTVATTPDPVPQDKVEIAAPAPAPAPPAPPAPPSVVQGADLSARMISGAPPRYPIECRRKKEQGTVVLALTLDTEGRVSSISVSRSSGYDRLDDAALSAVRKWRWSPLTKDGKPVMVKGTVAIPFVLTNA